MIFAQQIEQQLREAVHEAMKPDADQYACARVQDLLDLKTHIAIENFRAKIERIKKTS